MRALTWQGNEHVEVTDVPDPAIQEPNEIIIRVTSTAICRLGPAFVRSARPVPQARRRSRARAHGDRRGDRPGHHPSAGRRPGGDSV
jgi:hypothetical protein